MEKAFLIEVDQQLPYSAPKQAAILGHLLTNDPFFLQCVGKMRPDWFVEAVDGRIFRAKADFYNKFKKIASVEEIKNVEEFIIEDSRVRNSIHSKIDYAVAQAKMMGLPPLAKELTEWMHARMFHVGMHQAAGLYNQKQSSKAIEHIHDLSRQLLNTRFEEDKEERFDHFEEDLAKHKLELENSCTFGSTAIDRLLNPMAPKGALLRGDTTIIMAPVNVGKTTATVTVITHNLIRSNPVLWLSHEGRPADLKIKLWCSMLGVSQQKLFEMVTTDQGRALMAGVSAHLDRYLTFVPMNKPGLYVEDVGNIIVRHQEQRIERYGEGFKLVVDDYPGKLLTKESGGKWERRNIDHHVYNHFVGLALEHKFHSLLPIQTNREGSRINRGDKGKEERLLQMEDVAESFGTMQVATNVLSYNRGPLAEARERGTWCICKCRSNIKGWAICCRSNFSCSMTHSDELGATWYRGYSSMDDRIDELLEQHRNQAVPEAAF